MNYTVLTRYRLTKDCLQTNQGLNPHLVKKVILPNVGTYTVETISQNSFKVRKKLNITPNKSLVLAVAECRPQILKKILFSVGCFGARLLIIFKSLKSKEDYSLSSVYKNPLPYLYHGMEQSGNFELPEISFKHFFDLINFLKDSFFITFHPQHKPLSSVKQSNLRKILSAISKTNVFILGPEAGFHEKEISALKALKGITYSLGPLLFRVHQLVDGLLFLKNLQLNSKKSSRLPN